jgi:uncharacterized protein
MAFVRRHPVAVFVVLAYALAWGGVPWHSFFAPGALVAALVVVGLTRGVAGLRELGARLLPWRVNWVWYVVALAVPLLVHGVSILANLALGAPGPSTDQFQPWYGLPLAIGLHIVNPTDGPFSEEPSWRGFAQPALQARRSRFAATAIMAVLVTGWHTPLFLMPEFGLKPFEALTTVAVTFWYAWLFNRSGGSSLMTLIAHGTEGAIWGRSMWGGDDATRYAVVYLVAWWVVALGLLVADRAYWRSRDPEDEQAPEREVVSSAAVP